MGVVIPDCEVSYFERVNLDSDSVTRKNDQMNVEKVRNAGVISYCESENSVNVIQDCELLGCMEIAKNGEYKCESTKMVLAEVTPDSVQLYRSEPSQ